MNLGNGLVRFLLSIAVAIFYAFYVYKALRTGRARRYFGGWIASSEAPFSFYSLVALCAGLACFALYVAVKSGIHLMAR
jgi:hypothetical protein